MFTFFGELQINLLKLKKLAQLPAYGAKIIIYVQKWVMSYKHNNGTHTLKLKNLKKKFFCT